MSRSTADIRTRFTSTSPHASSKGSSFTPSTTSSPSSTPFGSFPSTRRQLPKKSSQKSAPPNETPQEKVARLRASHRAAKAHAALSPVDRIVERGRIIADSAHRIVVYGLIGFTGIASVVSAYALFDFLVYNRRQKRTWIANELQRLENARQAFLQGQATAEQLHLLELERAGEEIAEKAVREKERRKRESWWQKGKDALGMADKEKLDADAKENRSEEDEQWRYGAAEIRPDGEVVAFDKKPLDGLERAKWSGGSDATGTYNQTSAVDGTGHTDPTRKAGTPTGGPLDALAGNITNAITGREPSMTKKPGWLNWGR